jgi:hypothetical protein
MVLLIGGYALSKVQAIAWCKDRGIDPPESGITSSVNKWLRGTEIRTSLHACGYGGRTIYLFITHRRTFLDQTRTHYEPFTEDEHALKIKEKLAIDGVEFVTVSGAYRMWGIE